MAQPPKPNQYVRFSRTQRFEHFVLTVAFLGLALTGLPQMFSSQPWAQAVIRAMGGIDSVRIVHRFLATLLMVEVIYHIVVVAYRLAVLGKQASMWPGRRDLGDVRDWAAYNLGRADQPPRMPRYNFIEKAMYLGAVVGTLILIITGFMLWNPIAATRLLPGETIPAARVVHGEQALLALLVVLIWHVYTTVIRRFNPSIFTGKISREAMLEDHAEELEAIESGTLPPDAPAEVVSRRQRIFWPAAVIVTVLLAAGLYWFVTFEETAITTIPRQEEAAVFAPQALPEAGDPEVGAIIWSTMRCAFCHGAGATGGAAHNAPSLVGTTLTFEEFYHQVREGRREMPGFGPGEIPDGYVLHLWTWLQQEGQS